MLKNFFLFVFLILPFSLVGAQKKRMKSVDIEFIPKLYYGQDYEDIDNKTPVLILEKTFINISKTKTYNLCFWRLPLYIDKIVPEKFVHTTRLSPQKINLGKPSGPRKVDFIKLKPGASHTTKKWYWPTSDVLLGYNKDNTKQFNIFKEGLIEVTFLVKFQNCEAEFLSHLGMSNLHFNTGEVQAKPIKFDFKVLMKDD